MDHIPNSKLRRGRVQGDGEICPTLTALGNEIYRLEMCEDETHYSFLYLIDNEVWQIRIRKLTPRECGRLQDVSDSDIDKMEKVESNSQLYKAFGNSITVNCLTAIFGQMLEGKENIYRELIR